MFFDEDLISFGNLLNINELSINGRQVTNDDEDDDDLEDYTAAQDDNTDDEDDDIDIDNEDDDDLEDYTADSSYDDDQEDNNDAPAQQTPANDATNDTPPANDDNTNNQNQQSNDNNDSDVDIDADDEVDTDGIAGEGNDMPNPSADLQDALNDRSSDDAGMPPETGGGSAPTTGEGDGDAEVDDLTTASPDEGEDGADDTGDNQEGNDQDPSGAKTDDNTDSDPNSLKSLEKDLFADLTPEQLSIKNTELLQNYIDLYDSLETIFDNVNKIPKTYTNVRAIEFVADKLVELKEMTNQVITTTYVTKTYVENLAVYKQCLLMLQQLNTMLKGLVQHQPK